ncbi:helix-turn-helix transcriptional regulator [Agrobacterium sp. B1(2019)]|uniref:helix-turn-helix domain-containing protein n=1 Tax=Agrobacterium sp. B1(2019) TaxID=2607032 RepID=UPI0032B29705
MRKLSRDEIRNLRKQLSARALAADLRLPDAVLDMRKSLGLTQGKFADITGITKRQVAEIETGKANPTIETLDKIGKLFGFSLGFIPKDSNRSD